MVAFLIHGLLAALCLAGWVLAQEQPETVPEPVPCTQMKKKAFDLIAHAASNLNLHDSVVGRAQELFANFRDEREFVQKFDAVVAACVIQAAEESARDAVGASDADEAPVIPKPTVISRTQQLLMRPVASQKRKASGSAPAPKPVRTCCPTPRRRKRPFFSPRSASAWQRAQAGS